MIRVFYYRLIILPLILCFYASQVLGQSEISIKIDDINKDGVLDTLKSYNDFGSSFGGKYAKVINGKTGEIYELNTYSCFCNIKKTILIPPALDNQNQTNTLILKALKEEILPLKKKIPDISLHWILESSISSKKLTNNKYFDLIVDPQVKWNEGIYYPPTTYYIEVDGSTLKSLSIDNNILAESLGWDEITGIVLYYGHNHYRNPTKDSLLLVDSSLIYKAYRTSHGILVKKDKLFKWVFVSDFDLTGAPAKLRWESIGRVKLVDNYLIVHQKLTPSDKCNIYLVNIETGTCGRLKYNFRTSNNLEKPETKLFLIQGGEIILFHDGKQTCEELSDLFNELDKLEIKK